MDTAVRIPDLEETELIAGETRLWWDELICQLEETCQVKPKLDYRKCSSQRGGDVKYQKSGRSLCTPYSMIDHSIPLVYK